MFFDDNKDIWYTTKEPAEESLDQHLPFHRFSIFVESIMDLHTLSKVTTFAEFVKKSPPPTQFDLHKHAIISLIRIIASIQVYYKSRNLTYAIRSTMPHVPWSTLSSLRDKICKHITKGKQESIQVLFKKEITIFQFTKCYC